MPEVEPYAFVSLPQGGPDRKPPLLHERFHAEAMSGKLTCRLTAKTPLFVYDKRFASLKRDGHEECSFPVRDNVAIIPGSSIKGVIRSVAEAVESCCLTLFDRKYPASGVTKLEVDEPPGYGHCLELHHLCPACRLFGSLNSEEVFSGRVAIGDARTEQNGFLKCEAITLDVLSTPKPERSSTKYLDRHGNILGRKFYRHRLNGVLTRDRGKRRNNQNKTVKPVDTGTAFSFEVEYTDLREEELRLLLYALILEPSMWHKIGMGKPLGMGSACIEIIRWTGVNRSDRYRNFGGGISRPMEKDDLKTELDAWLQPYVTSQAQNLLDLREVWKWNHSNEVRYQTRRP